MDLGAIDLDGASGNTLQSNCGSNNAKNTVTLNGGSIDTGARANSVFYARNTKLTVGSVDVTGALATGEHVVKASVNSQDSHRCVLGRRRLLDGDRMGGRQYAR